LSVICGTVWSLWNEQWLWSLSVY